MFNKVIKNLIYQVTNKNIFSNFNLDKKKFYCGFDLTNDTLHIGHLSILIFCKKLYKYGFIPFILLGGGTTNIGDPYDHKNLINYNKIILRNTIYITKQINFIFKKQLNIKKYKIINNKLWLNKINFISFLKNFGSYFSIKKIINNEIIKINFIKDKLTYKEFSYILLQSYDFYYLYKKYNITLQIGGSDQWGNIISGTKLIKKKIKKNTYGITLPLITNKDGIKFSKSNNLIKNIWLDYKKTSFYNFYNFWLTIIDKKIFDFLKIFTFLNINFILKIKKIIKKKGISYFGGRLQKLLANEVTKIVWGKNILKKINIVNKCLFSNNNIFNEKEYILFIKVGITTFFLNKYNNFFLKNILIKVNLSSSIKKSLELIKSKSIFINNIININPYYILCENDIIYNKYTLLKKGKKTFILIIWI